MRSASSATLGVTGYVNEYMAVQHIVPALVPHLFPDKSNRRSSPRVVLGIPVAYRFGNTIAAALTLNISRGGLAVRTTSPLAVGTAVKVRFRLPTAKKDIDAEALIAWTDRRVGMGLQFTKLSAADQAHIDDYIQGHFFSNRKGLIRCSPEAYLCRSKRNAFATTITDAPVSASTAIQSVAEPVMAMIRNAALSTSDTTTFVLTLRTVARASRSA